MQKGRDAACDPGNAAGLDRSSRGDAFACRNEYALAIDYEKEPPMFRISDTHYAATWLLDARAPEIKPPSPVCNSFLAEGDQREGCEETAERKKASVWKNVRMMQKTGRL